MRLATMYKKKKRLAMINENCKKIHVVGNNAVKICKAKSAGEKKGIKK